MGCRIVVLISGSGSNLQAVLDDLAGADAPAEVVAVISNKAEAYGLERARSAGIPTRALDHRGFADRAPTTRR
ncbi:formyltransferase family protein [Halopseudomonas pachastrellae]|nr:formyltransferase family protein [Halopseudomonas pachastrellae]